MQVHTHRNPAPSSLGHSQRIAVYPEAEKSFSWRARASGMTRGHRRLDTPWWDEGVATAPPSVARLDFQTPVPGERLGPTVTAT